ncbi:c-type cytochrome [Ahrensia marina]|uniref:Cytochrome C n=1 Tax=Ahrensia marina TaxID=1514904 RepID=A0A0N0E726_9HYPH|nr:cytochrome c [Ahrensia marina]KPB00642.1 cytochrome C [Ahrensia marina]
MNPKYLVLGFFGLAAVVFVGKQFISTEQNPHSVQATSGEQGAPLANVIVPELSAVAETGKIAFEANCASCHGVNAAGQDGVAPPLVHKIYEPNHHGDASFLLAVKNGVRAHHWRFGNMPQIKGVEDEEVAQIVVYVRELQRANGIQ